MMTPDQESQLISAVGEYAASRTNPCGACFYYDEGEAKPWRIADDYASESFASFDELLDAAKQWREAFADPSITLDAIDGSSRDYRGSLGGKSFRVQIREDAAPHWYDSDLTDDEKSQVLNLIDEDEDHNA